MEPTSPTTPTPTRRPAGATTTRAEHRPGRSRPATRSNGPTGIAADLAAEWARLRRRPSAIATVRSWQLTDEPFGDLDEFLAIAGFGRPRTDPATEAVLHGLLRVATHDQLAGRIFLQRILPPLLATVRRVHGRNDAALDELVGAAWITIREYGRHHRPRSLAAAIVDGAFDRAHRRETRRRSNGEVAMAPEIAVRIPAEARRSSCEELGDLLAAARADGCTDERDETFVRQLLAAGSTSVLAVEMGVTARTVRNHRERVTSRLRRVALAA